MASQTRYLAVTASSPAEYTVQLTESPAEIAQNAIRDSADMRYSTIMPAFLSPEGEIVSLPQNIVAVASFFHNAPHKALGALKPILREEELKAVCFTEGLASVVAFNVTPER